MTFDPLTTTNLVFRWSRDAPTQQVSGPCDSRCPRK